MEMFQSFNGRTKRWVKYKKMANGQTRIVGVKKKELTVPFKGVTKK